MRARTGAPKGSGKMREEIMEILSELLPGVDFEHAESLADDGVIDSLNVVNIVTEIAVKYDVEIPFEALVNENFNSVDAIVRLVQALRDGTYGE
jgi:acyl carrier protein